MLREASFLEGGRDTRHDKRARYRFTWLYSRTPLWPVLKETFDYITGTWYTIVPQTVLTFPNRAAACVTATTSTRLLAVWLELDRYTLVTFTVTVTITYGNISYVENYGNNCGNNGRNHGTRYVATLTITVPATVYLVRTTV